MAWNHYRPGIFAQSATNRPRSTWNSKRPADAPVRSGLTVWDFAHSRPHTALKWRMVIHANRALDSDMFSRKIAQEILDNRVSFPIWSAAFQNSHGKFSL
jgi:hypothetical protein